MIWFDLEAGANAATSVAGRFFWKNSSSKHFRYVAEVNSSLQIPVSEDGLSRKSTSDVPEIPSDVVFGMISGMFVA